MPTISREDASEQQRLNFLIANKVSIIALDHALDVLNKLPAFVPSDQRPRILLEKATVSARLALLHAEFQAYEAEAGQFEPPSDTEVTQVKAAAANLNIITANSEALVGVIQGVTQLLNAMDGTAAAAAAAAADAAAATAKSPAAAAAAPRARAAALTKAMRHLAESIAAPPAKPKRAPRRRNQ